VFKQPPETVRVVIDSFNFLSQNAEMKFNLIFITASKTLTNVGGTMSVPRFLKKKNKLMETIIKILRRKNSIEKHFYTMF
jgi:hypothetical protein